MRKRKESIMSLEQLTAWLAPDLAEGRAHMSRALEPRIAHDSFAGILRESVGNTGKMLRPILMLLVAGTYDRACREELLATAAAYELGHTASLILDDVIDGASLRRGVPSVQSSHGVPVALCSSDYRSWRLRDICCKRAMIYQQPRWRGWFASCVRARFCKMSICTIARRP